MNLVNYCFIDGVNLYKGIKKMGWFFNNEKLAKYLKEKYKCKKIFYHIGYIPKNNDLYTRLQEAGFILKFKPTIPDDAGKPKGNVDADLVLEVMLNLNKFKKAVIVSGDGDYYSLVKYLYKHDKLKRVLVPNKSECSGLLEQEAREKIDYMDYLKKKLALRNNLE